MSISPNEDDLVAALRKLRVDHPTTGAVKLVPLLLNSNPDWTVSEKRVRKTLAKEGLSASTVNAPSDGARKREDVLTEAGVPFPSSALIAGLDVSKWTSKIKVEEFGRTKGKGLVATERIEEGEHVWVEDPIFASPEMCVVFC